MAWDWGAIAGAAASLYSANRAASAAKDAGNQMAQGSADSNALLREFYNRDEARQQPFYQAGVQGLNEYMAMLGMGGQQAASAGSGGTGPQTQGWMTGPAQASMPTQWLGDTKYVPTVNKQLYSSDPAYRQAWDRATKEHRDQWGKDYTGDSDRGVITNRLQTLYNQYKPKQTAAQQPAASTKTPQQMQQDAFAKFRSAPGYQFGLDEGRGQIEASAAARGGLNSGATMKALQRYGNDYADQQGYTPYMNRLASLFGAAQTSAGQMGQSGQYYGGQMGQNTQNAANARAQSTYGANQAWQQGINNAAGFMGDWYGSR